MNGSPHRWQPLMDRSVLVRLRDELPPGSGICEGFVRDYIALLPSRVDRLNRAVERADLEAAMDAVLSLKTSSLMVGACRLGALAGSLESELRAVGTGAAEAGAMVFHELLENIDSDVTGTVAGLSSWSGD